MYGINNILSSVSESLTPPESLTGYGDTYIVTDLRKRGKKEPNDTKAYSKGFEWRKDKRNSYGNFTRDIFDLTKNKASYEKGNAVKNTDYVHIYARYNDGFLETPLTMFIPETLKGNEFRGYENNMYTRIDKNKVFNYLDDYPKLEGFITKEYYKDLFNQNIDYQIGLMNNRIKNYPQYKNESEKELKYFKLLYSNPAKYQLFSKTSGLNVTVKYRPEILENSNLIDAPVKTESPAPETKKAQESAPVESPKAPEPTPEPKTQESAPESHFVTPELVAYHISNNDFKKAIDELIYANQHPGLSKIDINKFKALLYSKLFTYAKQHDAESIRQIIDYVKQSRLFTPNHSIFKILDNEKILKEQQKTESTPAPEPKKAQESAPVESPKAPAPERAQESAPKISPLLKEVYRIKSKYLGAILLFKVGDYFETFGKDAEIVSNTLNLPLINRSGEKLSGFPAKYLKRNVSALVRKGYKVAVSESFEFNNNDELKAFLNDNKENLIDSYIDADIADESPLNAKKIAVNGVGNPPAGIFNCPESELICNGFVPTYQRLDDYSHLIDTAENNNVLKGYGFDDTTLNTLIDAVKHYKQVARLAAHLAADTPEQTAFNIWHWLHCNVAYNYDTTGREEIRTPARTWSDRKSGVDCDCLSVFTAALLINLGYHPKFEIVAFANKPQFSHIYVNLDGLAIDRVLPTFNRRPMLITKTMLMDIPVYQLSGLSGINAELQGVYENALRRYAHTQDGEDLLNMRKTQILVSLQGSDYNGFRLAGLLMPYVQGIDDEGGYYFDNEEIANIAANADNDVIAAEMRGASESELGKLFKKIGKALKKAAKKVGSAVKAVAKTTAKAVTTVAKTTAKATKAAVKSAVNTVKATANVVKAGAQAVAGKGSAAKATLKKAGQQVKAAVVQPVKTAVQNTKAVVKNVVVEPTKTAVKVTIVEPTKTLVKAVAKTIKIAGKIFKVILVKINPITVLMRNSLRLLIAVNFLGMATRLNVANMTQAAAIAAGYTAAQWNDAKKAYDRVIKFFTKMGGKKENIQKSIVNGAKKKALFKKDYKLNSQIIEKGSDDATLSGTGVILNGLDGLGAAVTIGSALAAVGAFFKTIWKWLCKVVPKAAKATVNVIKKVAQNDDVKKIATAAKDAAVNKAVETVTKKIGGNTTTPTTPTTPDMLPPDTTPKKSNNWLKWALLAAAGVTVVGLAASGKKKRKKAA